MTVTLILEIAAGIMLGSALTALIGACRKRLLIVLMFFPGLAVTAVGIVILYSICGSWQNVALVVLGLAITGAIIFLANSFDSHKKFGPSFRALASTIAVAITIVSFTSLLIQAENLMGSHARLYFIVLPGLVVSACSARFFYRYALRNELSAERE